jgi:aerobic carbon-monoxide dehydrogenase large subunit
MLLGPYRVPAYAGRATVVVTNKTPAGTYRAPGRFEGNYVREHLLDLAADRLGIDKVELRARNLLRTDELPCERPLRHDGDTIRPDEGDYHRLLEMARRHWEEAGWPAEVERLRADGRVAGMGMAFFLEHSGSRRFEAADVELDSTGRIRVAMGGAQLGQGIETAMAQIAADVLSIEPGRVFVECGDSEQAPEGFGSFGSRSTLQGGSAVHGAAVTLRSTLLRVAADVLETDVRDLRLEDGRVHVVGMADAGLEFEQIAQLVLREPRFIRDDTIRLRERHQFELEARTHPYGVHAAIVELDPTTGHVTCHRYLVAVEVGRAVNPTLVEGQVAGGVAQGLGGALMEEFRYDDAGQPLSSTFMDYLVPTAVEVPVVETLITEDAPARNNPLGIRGVGEAGVCAVGGVVANAVLDALGDHEPVAMLPIRPGTVLERLVRRENGPAHRRTA